MAAYVIVDTKIHDVEAYEGYKAQARPIAEKFGGVYRARGGRTDVIDSKLWTPTRIVIVEFPSREDALNFINSPEYAPVKEIRLTHADCTTIVVEGV